MNRAPIFAFTPAQHEREQLGIRAEQDGATLIVRLTSPHGAVRLTDANIRALSQRVREAMDGGANWLILDLRECLDISSKGMGVLVSMRNALKGNVTIVAADAYVRPLFDAYQVADLFRFWPQMPSDVHAPSEVMP